MGSIWGVGGFALVLAVVLLRFRLRVASYALALSLGVAAAILAVDREPRPVRALAATPDNQASYAVLMRLSDRR